MRKFFVLFAFLPALLLSQNRKATACDNCTIKDKQDALVNLLTFKTSEDSARAYHYLASYYHAIDSFEQARNFIQESYLRDSTICLRYYKFQTYRIHTNYAVKEYFLLDLFETPEDYYDVEKYNEFVYKMRNSDTSVSGKMDPVIEQISDLDQEYRSHISKVDKLLLNSSLNKDSLQGLKNDYWILQDINDSLNISYFKENILEISDLSRTEEITLYASLLHWCTELEFLETYIIHLHSIGMHRQKILSAICRKYCIEIGSAPFDNAYCDKDLNVMENFNKDFPAISVLLLTRSK